MEKARLNSLVTTFPIKWTVTTWTLSHALHKLGMDPLFSRSGSTTTRETLSMLAIVLVGIFMQGCLVNKRSIPSVGKAWGHSSCCDAAFSGKWGFYWIFSQFCHLVALEQCSELFAQFMFRQRNTKGARNLCNVRILVHFFIWVHCSEVRQTVPIMDIFLQCVF